MIERDTGERLSYLLGMHGPFVVLWAYSVAYKRPGSGRLQWIHTGELTPAKASRAAAQRTNELPERRGFTEYGISRTRYVQFVGWRANL